MKTFREQRVSVPLPIMTLLETIAAQEQEPVSRWVQRVFEAGFPWLEALARKRAAGVPDAQDWEL